jgi:endonuclease/exonuclease/phosphatase family metal-dependent hydrolase
MVVVVTVLSWNVCMRPADGQRRMGELARAIREREPDVVALQEMTRPLLAHLLAADGEHVATMYTVYDGGSSLADSPARFFSSSSEDEIVAEARRNECDPSHFLVFLSRRSPMYAVRRLRMPRTDAQRYKLEGVYERDGVRVRVCNVHFESHPKNVATRRAQLQYCCRRYRDEAWCEPVLIIGDMNILGADGAVHPPRPFCDAWLDRPSDDSATEGFTYDGAANPRASAKYPRARLDRAYWKPHARHPNIDVQGVAVLDQYDVSDHWGLVVEIAAVMI